MNSEKLHANNLEYTDAQKEQIAGMSPEEFERLQAEFKKDIAERTALAMELDYKQVDGWSAERRVNFTEAKDDDEYQNLLDKVSFAKTPSERAKAEAQLLKYQEARKVVAAKEAAAEMSAEPADANGVAEVVEAPELKTELNSLSDEEYNDLIERASMGDAEAQAELARMQQEHAEAKPEEVEMVAENGVEEEKSLEEGLDKLDGILSEEELNNVLEGRDYDDYGEVEKAEETLDKDFEEKLEEVDKERQSRVVKFFKKHKKLAKVALVAISAIGFGGGLLGSIASNFNSSKNNAMVAEAKTERSGEGIYNEWEIASRIADAKNGSEARIEDEAGAEKEDSAEKVSSTAKFTIDGKEFTYENMKHEGGYDKGLDAFYDDDKDGEHSMAGPMYEGEWNGSAEQVKESYDGLMAALKGSPEIASSIAMVVGIPGAENVHSLSTLNDFADDLRNNNPEDFDKFMTEASDYINNFVDGGEIVVTTIGAGTEYMSSYTYGDDDDREIGIDKSVVHDYDVQAIDVVKDGKSLFNSPKAKAKIREMFGLSKKTNFTAAWSLRCDQLVIKVIKTVNLKNPVKVKVNKPERGGYIPSDDEPNGGGGGYEDDDGEPDPTPTPNIPTPTPDTPTPTPDTPTPTPETPTSTPETPETPTPTPTDELQGKGANTNAGPNQQQMGTTENTQGDKEVEASAGNRVDGKTEPGAAVPGNNTEGVNTDNVNPAGLNQTETQPTEDKSNPDSKTENIQHGGSADDLANRMAAAEAAEGSN